MATSTTTTSTERHGRLRSRAGFTLVEVGLVLLIIALATAIVLPQVGNSARRSLLSEARKMAVTYRFVRHEAILRGRVYRVVYDLDAHRYWVEWASRIEDEEPSFVQDHTILPNGAALPEPVAFSDILLPFTAGKVYEGMAETRFFPDGASDPTIVHLDNGQESASINLHYITGRVEVVDRYSEPRQPLS